MIFMFDIPINDFLDEKENGKVSSKKAAIYSCIPRLVFQCQYLQSQNVCLRTDKPESETLKSLKPYFLVKGNTVII